jgi:acetolactate synthase-1/2/3 large subunit
LCLNAEGDVKANLSVLLERDDLDMKTRADWWDEIAEWKEKYPYHYEPSPKEGPIRPQHVIARLYEEVADRPDDVIISTGVGCHQMWACQFYRWRRPNKWVSSGGLGTMGFGLPSAIGAQLAAPDKIVVDIDGDASFMMTMTELATAAQYKIPIKVLIMNNSFQGMVRQWYGAPSDGSLNSRIALGFTPLFRLKLCHSCDQRHNGIPLEPSPSSSVALLIL